MTSVNTPSSPTETSLDIVTNQRAPYSSAVSEGSYLSWASRLVIGAGSLTTLVYSLALLGLPSAYSVRTTKYASTPAERATFVAVLIAEWKIIVLGATFLLSIFAIVGLPRAIDHVVLKTLGFASLACGMMTVAFSSLLIVAFTGNTHHAHLDGHADDASVDVERQQVNNAPLSALFNSGQNERVFWNHHILIAQPATWMAWFSIFSTSFLLLFIWKANDSVGPPLAYISKSPIEAMIPGMVFTLIFTIGLVYLVLTVRMLRSL